MLNSNNAVLQGVGFAMLKNVMDTQEQMGAELTKMMEQSVNPSLGSNIDYRV
ncbi:MAG: YjfB family protein [Eubacterium sp.]|nr:YjfB family protein [Eubacterium sp.]